LVTSHDSNSANGDAIELRFDIDHSGSPLDATDWGIQILRSNSAFWGAANVNPNTWGPAPSANFKAISGASTWTAEVHLPVGSPSNLDLASGTVGVYIAVYNQDEAFSTNSVKYTQWPIPANTNDLVVDIPDEWGNYEFDPATTYPDIAITGIRNSYFGSTNPSDISTSATNTFEVNISNPGGTVIPDASGVRVNLSLAAVYAIGWTFHRLDTESVLDSDCSAAVWEDISVKTDVCNGSVSRDDLGTMSAADMSNSSTRYTIKQGTSNRAYQSATVSAGTSGWQDIIEWSTTSAQDTLLALPALEHQCMKAHAIVPNDPNPSNNTRQQNMNFVSLPGPSPSPSPMMFYLGPAAFSNYDSNTGKTMFLEIDTQNLRPQDWQLALDGVDQINEGLYAVNLTGNQLVKAQTAIAAPPAKAMGLTLKENLIVPPKAGGRHSNAGIRSGERPVYVKVTPGTTITVTNYAFDEKDAQHVDLDGKTGFLPANGPNGLGMGLLDRLLERVNRRHRVLMVPKARLGALVGSFNDFEHSFEIGPGVQVTVPEGAEMLALGINDLRGLYRDNRGTGFRVKVVERRVDPVFINKDASEDKAKAKLVTKSFPKPVPVEDVLPTICVNGYEAIDREVWIGGEYYQLQRYIGQVCWKVLNVYPPDRSDEPDQSDKPKKRSCWCRVFPCLCD
jgi:hypothetical protein